MKPRSRGAKFGRFGKIESRPLSPTPNHWPKVPAYGRVEGVGQRGDGSLTTSALP